MLIHSLLIVWWSLIAFTQAGFDGDIVNDMRDYPHCALFLLDPHRKVYTGPIVKTPDDGSDPNNTGMDLINCVVSR